MDKTRGLCAATGAAHLDQSGENRLTQPFDRSTNALKIMNFQWLTRTPSFSRRMADLDAKCVA
jgi:hypothetical protein